MEKKLLRKEKVAICFIGCTLSSCHESAHSASKSELSLGAPSHHSTLSRARGEPRCFYVARLSGRVAHFSTALTARSSKHARLAARPTHERQPGEHEVQTIFGASPEADFLIDRTPLFFFSVISSRLSNLDFSFLSKMEKRHE